VAAKEFDRGILLCGTDAIYRIDSARDLLPISFDNSYL